MKIVCDNCSTKYSIADEKVRGKVFKIKCKKCSHIIVVKGEAVTGEGQPAGFDQKETRVFDYSGFEGQRPAGGATEAQAGADPIWHLVIDREQVGPLTVAELAAKWTAGEIDKETYAWREGFADWQRIGGIEELATLTARGGAAAPAAPAPAERRSPVTDETDAGGLFGGATSTPAAGSAPTSGRSDPADLFAGAGSSTEDEAPSDLFGGASDRAAAAAPAGGGVFASSVAASSGSRRSVREELFGSNEGGADVAGGAEPLGAAPRPEVRSMTAQRNENSVLFSLNNLSALAASEPQAAAPTTRSSGLGSSFGGSGAEGSGLIDIRAMAAMTLGATKKEEQTGPRTRASEDDLPVFSATSFAAPAAGVLLPTVQPQAGNKLMYIFMGVVGLLATAAIVLVAVIFLGKKEPEPAVDPGAAATPSEPAAPATANPPSTPPPTPSATPSGTPAPAPSATPPSASPPPAAPAPAATPATERPAAPRTPEKRPERTPPRAETPRPTPAPAAAPAATPAAPPPAAPAPSKAAQKCDEVACLVSPDLPCCPKKGAGGTRPAATPSGGDPGVPEQLEQADIINGMKSVNGKVMACNDRFRVPGSFKVRITVGPDGNVSGASAEPPIGGTPAAGCVESAVRGAKFKKTKRAITFKYPYTFR